MGKKAGGANATPEDKNIKLHFFSFFSKKNGTKSWERFMGAMRFVVTSAAICEGVRLSSELAMRKRDWMPAAMITVSMLGCLVAMSLMFSGRVERAVMSKQAVWRPGSSVERVARRSARRPV